MNLIRIGFVPVTDRRSGGIFQYSAVMAEALASLVREEAVQVVPFLSNLNRTGILPDPLGASAVNLDPPSLPGVLQRLAKRMIPQGAIRDALQRSWASSGNHPKTRLDTRDWFRETGVKLVFYPAPQPLAFEARTPFVMAVHDLQHRLQPHFPEVSANGEWERREYVFDNAARQATVLIADSEVGREDILSFYGDRISPDRVKVLPFLPALRESMPPTADHIRRIRAKYALPSSYVFYPSQFWPHKNHVRLIQAVARLKQEGVEIPIVLSGSASGPFRRETFGAMMSEARKGKVEGLVRHIGYADDDDMPVLYRDATALVMPTFFGPTNIPILEAWECECPVLTSRLRGISEQAGDAAVLVDPLSVDELADGIARLWAEDDLRKDLVAAGRRRLRRYTPADYRARLKDIIEEAWAHIAF